MKKISASQSSSLLVAVVCLICALILLCLHEHVADINSRDHEYLGLLSTGVFGFFVTALVFFYRVFKPSNKQDHE